MPFTTSLRPWGVATLLLATSGCVVGLDTGPTFSLLQSVVGQNEALPEFARASGGRASMTVSGQIVGKLPCDEVRGDIEENGSEILVTITMVSDRQICNGLPPTTFSYIANILNVGAGEKDVRVRYRYQGTDGVPGVKLDTMVTVGG